MTLRLAGVRHAPRTAVRAAGGVRLAGARWSSDVPVVVPPVATNKAAYANFEPIVVSFAGLSTNHDYLAIAHAGTDIATEPYVGVFWLYANGLQSLPGAVIPSGTVTFQASIVFFYDMPVNGTYVIRAFANDATSELIAESAPFTIGTP